MTVGRFQIILFRNIKLGSEYGKPINKFYFRIGRNRLSINALGWCLLFSLKRLRTYRSGKPISVEQFCKTMKARGVDLSKATLVEISINGITPITIPETK